MAQTPLHILRSRLETLAAQMEDDFDAVLTLADQQAEVEALAMLFAAADKQITGGVLPAHQYLPRVRQLLSGDPWVWHMADGGYSRVVVSLIDGVTEVMHMDLGLSRPRAKACWAACNGGRPASSLPK